MRARLLSILLFVAGAAGVQARAPPSTAPPAPRAAPPAAVAPEEIDLLPPEKPPDAATLAQQKEINDKIRRRRTMLQMHQLGGFATLASLTVAVTLGQLDYLDKYAGGGGRVPGAHLLGAAMADDLSRRQLVRRAALLAAARLAPGCARRLTPEREIEVACPSDPRQRLFLSPDVAPELGRAGGAVLVRIRGLNGGQERFLLVANAGTGFVAVDGLCTHQSCEVTWVQEDRQVECPCHLSRFSSDGAVLHPPAVTPLTAYPASLEASGSVVVDLATGDGVFPAVQNGQLVISLANYPALQSSGGAVLGHAEGHPGPIILARLKDGGFVAFDGRPLERHAGLRSERELLGGAGAGPMRPP